MTVQYLGNILAFVLNVELNKKHSGIVFPFQIIKSEVHFIETKILQKHELNKSGR